MKKKNIILTIMLIVCVGLLAGAVYLFNDIYPKAKPIRHPEPDKIVSVTLSCNTPDATIPMSEQYYEDMSRYISEAKPTRTGEQVYIEMPYEGIYESKIELLNLVLKYFEEG